MRRHLLTLAGACACVLLAAPLARANVRDEAIMAVSRPQNHYGIVISDRILGCRGNVCTVTAYQVLMKCTVDTNGNGSCVAWRPQQTIGTATVTSRGVREQYGAWHRASWAQFDRDNRAASLDYERVVLRSLSAIRH